MKISIDGKAINATEYHKDIYEGLLKDFGRQAFEGTIIADENGNIAVINPTVKTSWGPMLFLIELYIHQRISKMPEVLAELAEAKEFIKQLNERIDEMEEKINGASNPPK